MRNVNLNLFIKLKYLLISVLNYTNLQNSEKSTEKDLNCSSITVKKKLLRFFLTVEIPKKILN